MINEIQKAGFLYDGIILNPGGYTHTSVAIGDVKNNPFQKQLRMYAPVDLFAIEKDAPLSVFEALEKFLVNYQVIIRNRATSIISVEYSDCGAFLQLSLSV